MKEHEHFRIDVASIVFSIASSQNKLNYQMEESYYQFLSTEQPEIFIDVNYDGLNKFSLQKNRKIFDSEGPWSLYRINGKHAIVCGDSVSGSLPSRVALFDDDIQYVEINSETERLPNGLLPDPLQYPLAEVLMICLLAQGRGILVHACGIDDGGYGYLFAGNSTHGKTTMAKLWKDQSIILNDDRIVIRKRDGQFWMYGTPWHGEYTGVSPQGVPVEKIFFLRHSESHGIEKINGAGAASMVLARSFPPLWDSKCMKFTIDFCSQLISAVPCYRLNFKPDESVIDFIRCVK